MSVKCHLSLIAGIFFVTEGVMLRLLLQSAGDHTLVVYLGASSTLSVLILFWLALSRLKTEAGELLKFASAMEGGDFTLRLPKGSKGEFRSQHRQRAEEDS